MCKLKTSLHPLTSQNFLLEIFLSVGFQKAEEKWWFTWKDCWVLTKNFQQEKSVVCLSFSFWLLLRPLTNTPTRRHLGKKHSAAAAAAAAKVKLCKLCKLHDDRVAPNSHPFSLANQRHTKPNRNSQNGENAKCKIKSNINKNTADCNVGDVGPT